MFGTFTGCENTGSFGIFMSGSLKPPGAPCPSEEPPPPSNFPGSPKRAIFVLSSAYDTLFTFLGMLSVIFILRLV